MLRVLRKVWKILMDTTPSVELSVVVFDSHELKTLPKLSLTYITHHRRRRDRTAGRRPRRAPYTRRPGWCRWRCRR